MHELKKHTDTAKLSPDETIASIAQVHCTDLQRLGRRSRIQKKNANRDTYELSKARRRLSRRRLSRHRSFMHGLPTGSASIMPSSATINLLLERLISSPICDVDFPGKLQ